MYYTTQQVAETVGVTARTIQRWITSRLMLAPRGLVEFLPENLQPFCKRSIPLWTDADVQRAVECGLGTGSRYRVYLAWQNAQRRIERENIEWDAQRLEKQLATQRLRLKQSEALATIPVRTEEPFPSRDQMAVAHATMLAELTAKGMPEVN